MHRFKVGDRVRLARPDPERDWWCMDSLKGQEGVIRSVNYDRYHVVWDKDPVGLWAVMDGMLDPLYMSPFQRSVQSWIRENLGASV